MRSVQYITCLVLVTLSLLSANSILYYPAVLRSSGVLTVHRLRLSLCTFTATTHHQRSSSHNQPLFLAHSTASFHVVFFFCAHASPFDQLGSGGPTHHPHHGARPPAMDCYAQRMTRCLKGWLTGVFGVVVVVVTLVGACAWRLAPRILRVYGSQRLGL
ncbi:hypothetical protein BU24DRAFT_207371 [Aaosphaeria arxii CBS 175.79]|uniref:Uncharacterized protein n=1 Tax=Aaosphaeria arxii CBS 175.79 TaxID=1450172 RepID=A0A6A5XUM6_9PLEO|nr:uncharacterized protein BU24DRAFT_207371 [Aaosphaeria arxii CBS 175.79]KAF2016653.1 hypothetical protein BU24DRAFT_207371 [Aaosphaeria arxii CBS 175.79]